VIKFVDSTGHERYLGNLIHQGPPRLMWRTFGDAPEARIIPRSEWDSLVPDEDDEYSPYLPPVHDQDGIGMCNASATVAAMEYQRALQGLDYVALSGGDLYGRINGGFDSGSMLEDGLAESMRGGVCSTAECKYLDWRQGRRGSSEQTEARKRFRVLEAWLCPSFDACYSAVLQGFSLISGIMWRRNYEPDSKGWLPNGGSGGGGHAVMGYKPTRRGKQYGIWHQNSWSAGWGRNGRCVFPEAVYGGPVGGWWAVRQVVTEQGDVPAPRS